MTIETDALGGRLPLVDPAAFTGAQRELFDRVTATRERRANDAGFRITTPDGSLIGPFNACLLRPEVALKLLEFSLAAQSQTSLSDRVREVVILAVGAVWDAQFELYAHSALAHKAGLPTESITALVSGRLPDDLTAHEKIAGRVAQQLSTHHRIDDQLYREAQSAFGEKGLFDIATLIGVYHSVCAVLNLFAVPAPA
jgi:4-carboxymuconolactone decarboxylase